MTFACAYRIIPTMRRYAHRDRAEQSADQTKRKRSRFFSQAASLSAFFTMDLLHSYRFTRQATSSRRACTIRKQDLLDRLLQTGHRVSAIGPLKRRRDHRSDNCRCRVG